MFSFHHGDHIPDKNTSQGGRLYLGSWFQRVPSMVAWLHALGQTTSWWECMLEGMLHPTEGRKQRETQRGQDKAIKISPASFFLCLSSDNVSKENADCKHTTEGVLGIQVLHCKVSRLSPKAFT